MHARVTHLATGKLLVVVGWSATRKLVVHSVFATLLVQRPSVSRMAAFRTETRRPKIIIFW